ncbi:MULTISPECIES: hypothetical protein [Burkholderia]|uniref:hypothetical protein n=1 Tax=Burkholderia TaxID=32008 RepID=UPI000503CFEB|nr:MULTISPECIES: hypothetical protein [Burkholderia]KFL52877.1 hypothetical protein JM78_16010 [Burkholderia pyrrocinia]
MKRTGMRQDASRNAAAHGTRIDAKKAHAGRSDRQIDQRYDRRSLRKTNEFSNEYDARHRGRAFRHARAGRPFTAGP